MRHDVLLHDTYCAQYEGILSLLKDKHTSKSGIIQYISQAAKYNKQQKRKSDEEYQNEDSKCQREDDGEQNTTSEESIKQFTFYFYTINRQPFDYKSY